MNKIFKCKIPETDLIIKGVYEIENYEPDYLWPHQQPLFRDLIVKSNINENTRILIVKWIKEYLGIIPCSNQFTIPQDGILLDENNIEYLIKNCIPIGIKKIRLNEFEIRFRWTWIFRSN